MDKFKHQDLWLKTHGTRPYSGLFFEMGTGKTACIIWNIEELRAADKIDGALIIAPNGVYENWVRREWPKHSKLSEIDHLLWSSALTRAQRVKRESILHPSNRFRVLTMNIEALSRGSGVMFAEKFLRSFKDKRAMIVVDESSTIANRSKRTATVLRLSHLANYKRILTGTPITQSPFNLYHQLEFLEPGLSGCNSYHTFKLHYGVMVIRQFGSRSFMDFVGYKNLEQLRSIMDRVGMTVKKSECLDLPNKLYSQRTVYLTEDQAAAYHDMTQRLLVELNNGEHVEAKNALHKLLRLHQIVLGYLTMDDGTVVRLPHNRLEALDEVIDEAPDKQIVIFSASVPALRDIIEHLTTRYGKNSTVAIYGEIKPEARQEAIDKFQAGKARFLVGNQQVAGYGITLTAASIVVYYSNSYKLAERLQSEDRAHRAGLTHPVTYIDLVAPGSVDERVIKALESKLDIASNISTLYRDMLHVTAD